MVLDLAPVYHDLYDAIVNNAYKRGIILDESIISTIRELIDFIIGSLISSLLRNIQTKSSNDPNYTNDISNLAESISDFYSVKEEAIFIIQRTESSLIDLMINRIPIIDNLKIINYSVNTAISLFIEHEN